MADPHATIARLIREAVLTDGAIEPDDMLDDLGLDGLDRQTLAMDLEGQFHIEISDTTLEQWRTVADVIATVEKAHA